MANQMKHREIIGKTSIRPNLSVRPAEAKTTGKWAHGYMIRLYVFSIRKQCLGTKRYQLDFGIDSNSQTTRHRHISAHFEPFFQHGPFQKLVSPTQQRESPRTSTKIPRSRQICELNAFYIRSPAPHKNLINICEGLEAYFSGPNSSPRLTGAKD